MATVAFTELTIRSLKPGSYFDEKTPAFGLRVGKNRKTWIVMRGRDRTRTRIGHYPALNLANARRKALVLLGSPLEPDQPGTFAEMRAVFLRTHCAQHQRASTRKETERLLTKHFASLDRKQLSQVTTGQLTAILDGMLDTPSEAQHAFKAVRSFFRWAEARGHCKNPCTMRPPAKDRARERVLSDAELKAVYEAGEGPFGDIVRLLILTGQRRTEIGALKWTYIDLEGGEISFPPEAVKNGRRHTVPIGTAAAALLRSREQGGAYVFPARGREGPFAGYSASKTRLDKVSGVTGWTLHDLRRTFATNLAMLGVPPHVIERILNHVTGTLSPIALRYNKATYDGEMREALKAWESRLATILSAQPGSRQQK